MPKHIEPVLTLQQAEQMVHDLITRNRSRRDNSEQDRDLVDTECGAVSKLMHEAYLGALASRDEESRVFFESLRREVSRSRARFFGNDDPCEDDPHHVWRYVRTHPQTRASLATSNTQRSTLEWASDVVEDARKARDSSTIHRIANWMKKNEHRVPDGTQLRAFYDRVNAALDEIEGRV
jgi:hypothetical protein